MAMSKKDFIGLADMIKTHNHIAKANGDYTAFSNDQIFTLMEFCRNRNYAFMGDRWLAYIRGECSPNGCRV